MRRDKTFLSSSHLFYLYIGMLLRSRIGCCSVLGRRPFSSTRCARQKILPGMEEPTGPVRVRFAPSPTGMLHLGGLRTALFNYLLAQRYGGQFILRIEDTDQSRFVPGATDNIIRTLEWAGIRFDEGPNKPGPIPGVTTYFQSQRGDVYRRYAQELLDKGAAYRCFCTAGRLESLRAESAAQGRPPMYDRRCVHLSQHQIDEKMRTGESYTVRLLAPNPADPVAAAGIGEFVDIVHGKMRFAGPAGFDDAVLLKSDGLPTYHLANVVDDHCMEITHVLRGEEWLMSTPKHRALFKALGWPIPRYAHLPLLMNQDGTKLSKRNDDGPMQGYIDKGYLPEAVVNYAALLGWHPEQDEELPEEIFLIKDLGSMFSLRGLNRSKSVVSRDKLGWLNRQHLVKQIHDPQGLSKLAELALLSESAKGYEDATKQQIEQALQLCGPSLTFTKDVFTVASFLFRDPDLCHQAAVGAANAVPIETRLNILEQVLACLDNSNGSDLSQGSYCSAEHWVKFLGETKSAITAKNKQIMAMLRYTLTGRSRGPQLAQIMAILPVDVIRRRVKHAISIDCQK